MAVYIYTRVSTAEQVEGTSLEEQSRKCQGAAMIAGQDVTATFTDGAISGSVALSDRPEGGKLVAALVAGDTVIVSKIDRLFRSAADALATAEAWKAQGIALVVAEFGADPVTENGTSKLLFGILSMVAEFERGLIRERMADGRKAKKAKGGHIGGTAPFGFEKVGEGKAAMLKADPVQQETIAKARALVEGGMSIRKAVEALRDQGRECPSHVTMTKILRQGAAQ